MLMLSGVSGHQGEVGGFSTSQRREVIVFFHQSLASENRTDTRRETLPMEKKNSYRTEKDEIGGMEFCFYEII